MRSRTPSARAATGSSRSRSGSRVASERGARARQYAAAAMALQLWLLRHGEAVPHESKPDDDRELTLRGRRQAEAAGQGLAALGAEFSACYTSPKLRAVQTARLACQHLNVEPEEA